MNTRQISKILFQLDPMNTSCVENDLFDEYDDIATLISTGVSIKEAFDQRFWVDCLSPKQIDKITISIV